MILFAYKILRGITLEDIKDYREKELKQYVVANVLLFLIIHGILDFKSTSNVELVQQIISVIGVTLLSSVVYIFTLLIDNLISDKLKVMLMNFYFMCLPGEKIFTLISEKNQDVRFTKEEAIDKYSEIYDNIDKQTDRKKYENREWYKIYNKYRSRPMIFMSNREYLLMRDMYISTLALSLIYISLSLIFMWIKFNMGFGLYLLILILVTNIASHIKAKRFVFNVIAMDLTENVKEEK